MLTLQMAQGSRRAAEFIGFAERCLAEYDVNGWKASDQISPDDVSLFAKSGRPSPHKRTLPHVDPACRADPAPCVPKRAQAILRRQAVTLLQGDIGD